MQNLYLIWSELLSKNESLLQDLLTSLNQEKQALLENQIDLLRGSLLNKDKVCRKLALLEAESKSLLKQSLTAAELPATTNLLKYFETFEALQRKTLQRKREKLVVLSKTINRINQFNNGCINTYLGQMSDLRSLTSLIFGNTKTYAADGNTHYGSNRKSLLNRSI